MRDSLPVGACPRARPTSCCWRCPGSWRCTASGPSPHRMGRGLGSTWLSLTPGSSCFRSSFVCSTNTHSTTHSCMTVLHTHSITYNTHSGVLVFQVLICLQHHTHSTTHSCMTVLHTQCHILYKYIYITLLHVYSCWIIGVSSITNSTMFSCMHSKIDSNTCITFKQTSNCVCACVCVRACVCVCVCVHACVCFRGTLRSTPSVGQRYAS